jgi:hypothetical protein
MNLAIHTPPIDAAFLDGIIRGAHAAPNAVHGLTRLSSWDRIRLLSRNQKTARKAARVMYDAYFCCQKGEVLP